MKARVNASGDTLARIRELEAELEEEHRQNVRNLARAEKAETDARESLRLVRFMEARVAELERLNDELRRPVIREREAD